MALTANQAALCLSIVSLLKCHLAWLVSNLQETSLWLQDRFIPFPWHSFIMCFSWPFCLFCWLRLVLSVLNSFWTLFFMSTLMPGYVNQRSLLHNYYIEFEVAQSVMNVATKSWQKYIPLPVLSNPGLNKVNKLLYRSLFLSYFLSVSIQLRSAIS